MRLGKPAVLALLTFWIVGMLVVTPRPTYPQILPLPRIDRDRQQAREHQEAALAASVMDGSLRWEIRSIGEQVRRLGFVMQDGGRVDAQALRALHQEVQLVIDTKRDEEDGTNQLLALRALQARLFVQAVRRWERTGKVDHDLQELGGGFASIAAQSWRGDDGRVVLDDDELRLFFRVHWGKLTGLHGTHPFEPSLDELRRYYRTNLEHPHARQGDEMTKIAAQIGFVRALGRVDPKYPGLLAKGILELRLGQSLVAERSLRAYLALHPNGPFAQLARNHHLLAIRQSEALVAAESQ